MNTKGQFFLVFAIIIIFVLVMVTYTYNYAWPMVEIENFEELNDNYNYEKDVVINHAIYEGGDVPSALNEFGGKFSTYSATVDANYGFYQIYRDPNTGVISIQNFLSNGRTITLSGESLTGDEVIQLGVLGTVPSSSTTSTGTISLNLGGQIIEQSVSTELVNYNAGYNQVDINDVTKLNISIEGIPGEAIFLHGDLAMGGGATLSTEEGAIEVAIF